MIKTYQDVPSTAFTVKSYLCLNYSWELDDPLLKKFIDIVEEVNESFGIGILADFFPIFKHIPTPTERKLHRFNKFMKDHFLEIMREHRETYDPGDKALN